MGRQWLVFWLVALVSVTAQGLSKGGFAGLGTFAVPVMSLVISPLQALGILLPILLVQDVVNLAAMTAVRAQGELTY